MGGDQYSTEGWMFCEKSLRIGCIILFECKSP